MASRYSYKFNKIKPIILFAFDYKCAICNHFSISNHVHHQDHNFMNNDCYNFVVLCSDCHKIAHKTRMIINVQYTAHQVEIFNKLNSLF